MNCDIIKKAKSLLYLLFGGVIMEEQGIIKRIDGDIAKVAFVKKVVVAVDAPPANLAVLRIP